MPLMLFCSLPPFADDIASAADVFDATRRYAFYFTRARACALRFMRIRLYAAPPTLFYAALMRLSRY